MSGRESLLFEIGTEELPPKALLNLETALGERLTQGLRQARLAFGPVRTFAAPRRLAVIVEDLASAQPDMAEERRGPALSAAFDGNGEPTRAAIGFARSCGVEVSALETLETDKGAWLVHRFERRGSPVQELMPDIVREALAGLPIPRRMRWGTVDEAFVRPVHWIVLLYGGEVVPGQFFGLASGRESRGHRFHSPGTIGVPDAAGYAPLLETQGRVLVDFAERREAVRAQVVEAARALDASAAIDPALLDEVTAMVEWPCAITGSFERRFLDVPEEALISVMKSHQKYFHLRDAGGRLLPAFVTVANIDSRDPQVVRAGNERVIRPRFSDAMFFWEQDRRRPLETRLESLRDVVFQRRLGTLHQKTERLALLVREIAGQIGGEVRLAERAAWLAKCDLVTEMVGEFPELQGIMGAHYARHDGEPDEVARAIAEQYLPRAAGDALPVTRAGQALAIADKLDTVVGIFGIGQAPTGDKDPFALRRAALGVARIMVEGGLPLDLDALIGAAVRAYRGQRADIESGPDVRERAWEFVMERLRAYYQEAGIGSEVFDAVIVRRPSRPLDFDARIRAVQEFRSLPEAASLAAANKRIGNILRKTEESLPEGFDETLLRDAAERALGAAVRSLRDEVEPLLSRGEYAAVLRRLAALREPVDTFFDEVLVMDDDTSVRLNRLALLGELQGLFLRVADLSCLSGGAGPGDPRTV